MDISGSQFESWRLASLEETQTLMTDFGIPLAYGTYSGDIDIDIDNAIKHASSLLGDTVNVGSDYYENGFMGFVESPANPGIFNTIGAWSLVSGVSYGVETLAQSALYPSDHITPWIGTYLVRDSSRVPEPATIILFLTGFMLLRGDRKCLHKI